MRQLLLCLTAVLFTVTVAYGQTQFHMRYGSPYRDEAKKVIQTQDGNFLVVGITNGFGSAGNALIMKVNATGNILWTKDYSGINGDIIYDIIELSDKKLVMCGATNSYGSGGSDAFAMKTDSVGNIIWAKVYGSIGGEIFYKIIEDGTNGFFLSGYYELFSSPSTSLITRIDSVGNVLWAQTINDYILGDECLSLVSGGVVFAEHTGGNASFSVYKFSLTGNLIWSNNYFPTPAGTGLSGLSILAKNNGDILLSFGIANVNTVAQALDIFIVTLNSNGGLISDQSYGATYSDDARSIANTNDGGTIICGATNSAGNGDMDACLIKLSANGTVQWAKAYGTVWEEESINAVQTTDNGFVLTGQTYSVGSLYDSCKVYLVKTDSIGNSSCHDISWTPIVNNQTLSISTATTPVSHTFAEGQINWALNNRYFYTADICNPSSVVSLYALADSWNIYPNPFSTQTTLQTDNFFHDATFTVDNYLGQTVKEIKNISGQTVTLSRDNLPSGLYFVRLTQDYKVIATKKLVITD